MVHEGVVAGAVHLGRGRGGVRGYADAVGSFDGTHRRIQGSFQGEEVAGEAEACVLEQAGVLRGPFIGVAEDPAGKRLG